MGFGWENVHDIAEQIEHIQSSDFFEKMDELLGYPKIDPHGSPIPDKNGNMVWKEYIKLSDCVVGEMVVFSAVMYANTEFLKLLNARELRLGLSLKVMHVEAFDGTMTISYQPNHIQLLSKTVCERILVEKK